jgi:hypothetical protein
MPEQLPSDALANLRSVAQLLREAPHLDPEAQQALADLVEELGQALVSESLPATEKAHLAESTAHLVDALRHGHDKGLLSEARDRLARAVVGAEVRAPLVAGVVRRLVDALANLGI